MLQKIVPALACFLAAGTVTAQISGGENTTISTSSMHELMDGRSTALGESVVARARTPLAWNSNPATLAGADGVGIDYSSRSLQYFNDGDFFYSSAGAFVGTPIGTFALHYNRLDFGDFIPTFDTGVSTNSMNLYNETIALGYATDLLEPVSVGVTVKRFRDPALAILSSGEIEEPDPGFYIDLGGIFSAKGFLDGTAAADSIHAGASIQNLGGDYTYNDIAQAATVGQWFRAGFAYDLGLLMQENTPRLRASLTAEYRRLLNPPEIWESADYMGAGLEATIYNILILRAGMMVFPVDNIYAEGKSPAFRYGAGLNLPFSKIGLDQPLTVGLDYSFIPLNDDYFITDPGTSPLHAFNVSVHYNAPIF